jgi:hypothetical protein
VGFKKKAIDAQRFKEYIWNICELIHLQAPLKAQDDFVRQMDAEGLYNIKEVEEDVLEEE